MQNSGPGGNTDTQVDPMLQTKTADSQWGLGGSVDRTEAIWREGVTWTRMVLRVPQLNRGYLKPCLRVTTDTCLIWARKRGGTGSFAGGKACPENDCSNEKANPSLWEMSGMMTASGAQTTNTANGYHSTPSQSSYRISLFRGRLAPRKIMHAMIHCYIQVKTAGKRFAWANTARRASNFEWWLPRALSFPYYYQGPGASTQDVIVRSIAKENLQNHSAFRLHYAWRSEFPSCLSTRARKSGWLVGCLAGRSDK
ncbi:predicted protein [Coccidioides posadasii str. Silveira]|uniref:Predicted protein n=1 Tax=Coccidioides posadasii (strain RMSCC 757 / Silveira) TaxID=443226 RepID=E9DID3_COCPS|nr:predicted protein [Coccidioides posadasii str. Silveira]